MATCVMNSVTAGYIIYLYFINNKMSNTNIIFNIYIYILFLKNSLYI